MQSRWPADLIIGDAVPIEGPSRLLAKMGNPKNYQYGLASCHFSSRPVHSIISSVALAPPATESLQAGLTAADALVERAIEAHEGMGDRVVEINRVITCCGIESVFHEIDLLVLEGGGDFDLVAQADEDRSSISRQTLNQMVAKRRQVEMLLGNDRRHAGAAVAAGNLHSVDVGLQRVGELADGFLDFGGGDVLAFPAEGVTDAVDEGEVAGGGLAHQVAGSEPDVACLEHIAQDLPVGLALSRITLETGDRLRRVLQDLADDLTGFVEGALDAEALLVADRLLGIDVKPHHFGGEAVRDEPGNAADGALLAVEIDHRHVAFRRGVELDDLRNAKAVLELPPDFGT